MSGVSASLAKSFLLLCFCGHGTCKLGTLTPFETRSASRSFETRHKGSYCGTPFNQARADQLAFKLMTLLCICSIDLLSSKLEKTTLFQVALNAAPTTCVKLCGSECSWWSFSPFSSLKAAICWSQCFPSLHNSVQSNASSAFFPFMLNVLRSLGNSDGKNLTLRTKKLFFFNSFCCFRNIHIDP